MFFHFPTELAQQRYHRPVVSTVRVESPVDCADLRAAGKFAIPSNIVHFRLRQSNMFESIEELDMHTGPAIGETLRQGRHQHEKAARTTAAIVNKH